MADPAHIWTDEKLAELEKKIRKVYKQAAKEVSEKLDDYMRRFEIKDSIKQDQVKRGVITEEDYKKWRESQIIVGKRWEDLRDSLAYDYHNANLKARELARSIQEEVYAENINFATYSIEQQSGVDTSFILYDKNTVRRLLNDDPDLLPPPGKKVSKRIAEGKDVRWNKQQIQAVMLQAILQGESIPKIANRLANEVGEKNHKAAIRNARTMTTGAECAGRIDGFRRAEELGIDMEQEWRATLDMRTRHEHRMLDGVKVAVGEPWKIDGYEIRFPGDPEAPGHLIYNCRCTVRALVTGLEPMARKYRSTSAIGDMTYEQWKQSKVEIPNPIDLPEKKAEAIKKSYIKEYKR